ncbi:MAG: hypothetical protein ACPHRO_14710 [Nannocystaceae bacterium]
MKSARRMLLLGLSLSLFALTDARAADHVAGVHSSSSLGISMFEEEPEAAWPLEVEWEILDLARPGVAPRKGRVVAKGGQETQLTEAIRHSRGQDTFALQVAARNHARHETELEYRLSVSRAEWASLSIDGYIKHRLGVGPAPTLGASTLRASRADIVSASDLVTEQEVEIDGTPYLVRIRARSLAG